MRWSLVVCLSVTCGCGAFNKIAPDRISVGVAARQLKGSYKGFRVKTVMPLYEVRTKKTLSEHWDAVVRIQANKGEVGADHPHFRGSGAGGFISTGAALDYYPLKSRLLGVELGAETYRAGYRMRGSYGPVSQSERDRFWGLGGNLGLVGEIPLDRHGQAAIVWGAGYNFTHTENGRARANLDEWSGGLGIQITLGK